jgi:hypothetical protein
VIAKFWRVIAIAVGTGVLSVGYMVYPAIFPENCLKQQVPALSLLSEKDPSSLPVKFNLIRVWSALIGNTSDSSDIHWSAKTIPDE